MQDEHALALRSQELETIYQTAPIGLAVLDRDLRFVRVNDRLANMHGAAATDYVGQLFKDVFPDLANQAQLARDALLKTGQPRVELSFSYSRDSVSPSTPKHFSQQWYPIRAENGEVTALSLQVHTIAEQHASSPAVCTTNHRLVEQRLAESEERLASIFREAPAGLSEISLDGHFLRVNQSLCDMLQRSPQDLTKLTIADVTEPSDYEKHIPLIQAVVQHGTPFTVEKRYIRPDGSRVWATSTVSRIHDREGRPVSLLAVTIDDTERMNALELLRDSRRRLDAVLNNTSLSIFWLDELQRCVYMNPAAEVLTGYSLDNVRNHIFNDVAHPVRADGTPYLPYECPIDKALPENTRKQGEEIFSHRDGHRYPVAFIASPVRDGQAQVFGTVVEVRDITSEKATLEALHDADRAKDEFLAMLGHELRNPLAPIVTSLKLMELKGQHSREQEVISRQVNHLTRLVDDLLDVSKVTRGLIELRKSTVELSEIVARSVEIASPLIEQRHHHLEIDVAATGLRVDADAARMAQVVSNLLTNAAKFSEPGSTIQVKAWADADCVFLSVKDQGAGISKDMLERVFDPFVQDLQGKDRSKGGLGLGLAIARSLVRLHGGNLVALSEGLNKGSEFLISIPPAVERLKTTHSRSEAARFAEAIPKRRVMVVDDNRDAADALKTILENVGHTVLAVYDPATALEQLDSFSPDIAVLDIGLPVMDGYELGQRIKTLNHGHRTRLIALTGYGLERDKRLSLDKGFEAHFVKPVAVDRLLAQISSRDSSA
ncbi:MAG TPA: PAS domain S-box protein [Burkholderiaceae bacterium]|nr:PAS domain S-box protein [Burkholderiaceae bacterium]